MHYVRQYTSNGYDGKRLGAPAMWAESEEARFQARTAGNTWRAWHHARLAA